MWIRISLMRILDRQNPWCGSGSGSDLKSSKYQKNLNHFSIQINMLQKMTHYAFFVWANYLCALNKSVISISKIWYSGDFFLSIFKWVSHDFVWFFATWIREAKMMRIRPDPDPHHCWRDSHDGLWGARTSLKDPVWLFISVFRIRFILIWIRIRRSVSWNNGSGSGSGSGSCSKSDLKSGNIYGVNIYVSKHKFNSFEKKCMIF